jgi:uncharacterized protein
MRNRPVTSKTEITDIIRRSRWCHVAMVDQDNKPYMIPMNFGFCDDVIYIHGAGKGKKIGILQNNPEVCINFSIDQELRYQSEEVACSWSMKYRSVLCYGKVEFIEDPEEKVAAMNQVMAQYTERSFSYNPPSIREVKVMRIKVERFEGRVYGY